MLRSSAVVWLLVGCPGQADVVAPSGPATVPDRGPDLDGDGVADDVDNCVDAANPGQQDVDANGVGDACDGPPDLDLDLIPDFLDNCPSDANPDQLDTDDDGHGDVCDTCPELVDRDQADADGDGVGDACPCDACGDAWCVEHPTEPLACQERCLEDRQGADAVCCPAGTRWNASQGDCPLPDLFVDASRTAGSLQVVEQAFAADDCAVTLGCVAAAGSRRVLRFDAVLVNDGPGDAFLGSVADGELGSDACLGDHVGGLLTFELLAADGRAAAPGHTTGGCLHDEQTWAPDAGVARYTCTDQGLTRGWSTTLGSDLPCQLVDVTDVAPGTYTLRVEVDADRQLAEVDTRNNVAEVAVILP